MPEDRLWGEGRVGAVCEEANILWDFWIQICLIFLFIQRNIAKDQGNS